MLEEDCSREELRQRCLRKEKREVRLTDLRRKESRAGLHAGEITLPLEGVGKKGANQEGILIIKVRTQYNGRFSTDFARKKMAADRQAEKMGMGALVKKPHRTKMMYSARPKKGGERGIAKKRQR